MKKIVAILFLIFTTSVLVYFYQNNPSDKKTPYAVCMTKNISGLDCPGCGGQRALHHLLHFDFSKAAKLNFFIYLFFPLLLYIVLLFCLKPFGIVLPDLNLSTKTVIIFIVILVVFTILRNIPHYPFSIFKS
jgi:hypothetical protein